MNFALFESRNIPNWQNSEPLKLPIFELLDSPKLISRKKYGWQKNYEFSTLWFHRLQNCVKLTLSLMNWFHAIFGTQNSLKFDFTYNFSSLRNEIPFNWSFQMSCVSLNVIRNLLVEQVRHVQPQFHGWIRPQRLKNYVKSKFEKYLG